jgi:hypothetical protein
MSAYVLIVLLIGSGGSSTSQQQYANVEACTNAQRVITQMHSSSRYSQISTRCVPMDKE